MKVPIIAAGLLLLAGSAAQAQVPICVLDGIVVANCAGVQTLDRERIESIEILKGEAARKLYGNEGAGGVIVIRTRNAPASPHAPGGDPLAEYLFSPELVMANQQAIGLTDAQRPAIRAAATEAQEKFLGLQFVVGREMEKLKQLLEGTRVDQAAVLEQLDRIVGAEREIKREQLTLMIRIKNQLTEQQQTTLRTLRR